MMLLKVISVFDQTTTPEYIDDDVFHDSIESECSESNNDTDHSGEKMKSQDGTIHSANTTRLFKACMSLAFMNSANSTNPMDTSDVTSDSVKHEPFYFDASENIQYEPFYFDAEDSLMPPKPGKVMHLSIDYQTIGKWEKGRQAYYTSTENVDSLLSDVDYHQLVGKNETFNTLVCALTSVEKMQQIEALQPRFAWKPLDVIKRTLESTTQWGKTITQYPMQKHHVSRFPWNNRRRLREEGRQP